MLTFMGAAYLTCLSGVELEFWDPRAGNYFREPITQTFLSVSEIRDITNYYAGDKQIRPIFSRPIGLMRIIK